MAFRFEERTPEHQAMFRQRMRQDSLEVREFLKELEDTQVGLIEIPEGTKPQNFKLKIKNVAKGMGRYVDVTQVPGNEMMVQWGDPPPPLPEGVKRGGRPKKVQQ